MTTKFKNNVLPISVKGKKKILAPLNISNKNVTYTTKKQIIKEPESKKDQLFTSREKFEVDCDIDKKDDAIFLSKLSEREKFFYEIKAKDIYDFLKSINLIRYIDSFINDGFETKEDLMEIQEDYFEENKNFNKNQQKKILLKAKEYLKEYNENNIKNNNFINNTNNNSIYFDNKNETRPGNYKKDNSNLVEMGVGGGDINNYFNNTNSFNRCWTCFNKLNEKNFIEIKYNDSMINKKVRFCSEKCKNKFEINIYKICDNCNIKYDKSKGEYIFVDKHFHSQKCLDEYLNKNKYYKDNNNNIIEEENYENNIMDNNEDIYDPMNDF